MNSFDVFDTLLARRFISSNYVWKYIENEFKIKNFERERVSSDTGTRSYDQIYDDLFNRGIIPDRVLLNKIKKLEIKLEMENSFGIKSNLDLVQHGDLLISDMYLDAATILNLIKNAGLNKQVSIYQSNSDKGNGNVWRDLSNNKPNLHLGDNPNTDYNKPLEYGFNAKMTKDSELTECENFIMNFGLKHLALLCREVRLKNNPQKNKLFFEISNQLNLPFLFVCCELLFRDLNEKDIIFLGRDCQLLWNLYKSYYDLCFYLPFSREVAFTDPETAIKYLQNGRSKNENIFVDMSSGGNTWGYLGKYAELNTKTIIFSDKFKPNFEPPKSFSFITKNSECGETNLLLEVFNCADHGRINKLHKITDKIILTSYAEHELDVDLIQSIHKPIMDSVHLNNIYKEGIRNDFSNKNKDELLKLFCILSNNICAQKHTMSNLESYKKIEDDYFKSVQKLHHNAK